MYEYILNLLKNKYLGVNDTILSRVAKKLAETAKTEDEAKTEVEGVTFQKLLDSYGDSRATEATKTAVANYEKKHNLKDGKIVETPIVYFQHVRYYVLNTFATITSVILKKCFSTF